MKKCYIKCHSRESGNPDDVLDSPIKLGDDNERRRRAFTLIELLISIAIVGMITVFTVVNFHENERKNELELAAEEVVAQINSAQAMLLAGRTVKICTESDCQDFLPRGGYGIHFATNNSQFIVFADFNNNQVYDDGESLVDGIKNIPINIEIKALGPNSSTASMDIIFEPPKARIYIDKNNRGEATITLHHIITGDIKIISVNSISGRVEIK